MASDASNFALLAIEALPHAVALIDSAGAILYANPTARRLLGDRENLCNLLQGGDLRSILSQLAPAGEVVFHNQSLPAPGGKETLTDWTIRRLDGDGEPDRRALVLIEDVADRSSFHRRLATGERLAGRAELAGRIAHELNNPLDGVLRYLSLAQRTGPQQAADCLAKARSGLLRMAQIIRDMTQCAAGGRAAWQAVDRLLDEAVGVMQPSASALAVAVVCEIEHEASVPAPPEVFQVFCNLIRNALEAMPDGGTLSIRLHRGEGRCLVEFADTGVGLPPGPVERIFEPFFTTKPPGRNVGLGLAVCRDILSRLGGTLSAGANPAGGAVFTVHLPCGRSGATEAT